MKKRQLVPQLMLHLFNFSGNEEEIMTDGMQISLSVILNIFLFVYMVNIRS